MTKKEGRQNKKRSQDEKEFYSIRSLVEEITGVSDEYRDTSYSDEDEDFPEFKDFDSAYKAVQRIVNVMQSQEGVESGKLKIHKDNKDGFVKATKAFFEDPEYKELLAKMRKGIPFSFEEVEQMLDFYLECITEGLPDDEKNRIINAFKMTYDDEYFDKAEKIRDIFFADMDLVKEIKNVEMKLDFMNTYESVVLDALKEWREKIEHVLIIQKAYANVFEKNPHLRINDPIDETNITPELLTKVSIETMKLKRRK